DARKPEWPITLGIVPKGGDPRRSYLVTAEARDENGETIAVGRVLSGFAEHEKRYVYLLLEDECVRVVCPGDKTCHAHACIDARIASEDLAQTKSKARVIAEMRAAATADAGDAGSMVQPGMDGGGSGGRGEAGVQIPDSGGRSGGGGGTPADTGGRGA